MLILSKMRQQICQYSAVSVMDIQGENHGMWEVINPLNPSLSGTRTEIRERDSLNNWKTFLLKIKFLKF